MKKIAVIYIFLLVGLTFFITQDLSSNNSDIKLENIIYTTAWASCDPCPGDEKNFEVDCPDGGKRIRCKPGNIDCSPTSCPIASQ